MLEQQMRKNSPQEKSDFKLKLSQRKFLYYLQLEDTFEECKSKKSQGNNLRKPRTPKLIFFHLLPQKRAHL